MIAPEGLQGAVLVVDVANVVGARPDGWWRDRAGAAQRLLRRLARLPCGACVAVVEGAARSAPDVDGVHVVRADGSGDDALVAAVEAQLQAHARDGGTSGGSAVRTVVVTADRGLRARLPDAVRVEGPRWLLDRLDALD